MDNLYVYNGWFVSRRYLKVRIWIWIFLRFDGIARVGHRKENEVLQHISSLIVSKCYTRLLEEVQRLNFVLNCVDFREVDQSKSIKPQFHNVRLWNCCFLNGYWPHIDVELSLISSKNSSSITWYAIFGKTHETCSHINLIFSTALLADGTLGLISMRTVS